VTFQNIIFQNGFGKNDTFSIDPSFGGVFGVYSNGILNIADCIFRNNTAAQGGAIYLGDTCELYVTNTLFDTNRANFGGAIRSIYESSIIMMNVTFHNNNAAFYFDSPGVSTVFSMYSFIRSVCLLFFFASIFCRFICLYFGCRCF
jgi:predicted outer membrane repeat protein